jgi:hypothetical protein
VPELERLSEETRAAIANASSSPNSLANFSIDLLPPFAF